MRPPWGIRADPDALVTRTCEDDLVLRFPPPPSNARQPVQSTVTYTRLQRRRSNRILGGVAGAIADQLNLDVVWVRCAFTVLAALPGIGVITYGLLWLLVPQAPAGVGGRDTGKQRQQSLILLVIGIGIGSLAVMFAGGTASWIMLPIAILVVGAAVVWREADSTQRRRWRDGAKAGLVGPAGWHTYVRIGVGAALVIIGLVLLLLGSAGANPLQTGLLAALATLVGAGVLTVPWWVRLVGDLDNERAERIRVQERADIAAHLHDSVLQTLALIQKNPDQPREVSRLARSQERQLRAWLYGQKEGMENSTLSTLLAVSAGEVEDTFAIRVQQVVVGDCPVDDKLMPLAAAAREAMVNAAKHAGVQEISVYAEVEPDQVSIFVRDRGAGFDPDAVPEDRHGVADSIKGRMTRHGGKVRIKTAPGEGTEVALHMPRTKEATS
ncbi:ATP-binding protein [Pseudonocardiaceae bacterium YIM PH 21723]|nr:ATP-binding protein [Pseudonocardiaceae bacterium YIM PH 21723]